MNDDKIKQHSDSQDVQIAKLEYVGAALASLGVGIKLIAAGLAVDVLEKSNKEKFKNKDKQYKELDGMQKQINILIKELKQLNTRMR